MEVVVEVKDDYLEKFLEEFREFLEKSGIDEEKVKIDNLPISLFERHYVRDSE